MKRIRHIYKSPTFTPIDSDDPRINGLGTVRAAMIFGDRAAKRLYGPSGVVLDIQPGQYHRMPNNAPKQGIKPQERRAGRGQTDWHILIGIPAGCDLYECQEIIIPISITRARGNREYYEEVPVTRPPGSVYRQTASR